MKLVDKNVRVLISIILGTPKEETETLLERAPASEQEELSRPRDSAAPYDLDEEPWPYD